MTSIERAEQGEAKSFRLYNTVIPARPVEPGLYLAATPIGNLGDITLRALEILAGADVIACEDKRVSRVLLDRYSIRTRPYAYHEHNEAEVGVKLIDALDRGKSVVLISDAGTPSVSDPGFRLARRAIAAGHRVVPVPGASAPLAALVGSGLPSDAFFFAGFLPARDHGRRERLEQLKTVPATLIIFESPHRIAATLAAASDILGPGRQAAMCRELTKTFEEFLRGSLKELSEAISARLSVKGEIVLVIGPPDAPEPPGEIETSALLRKLVADMPVAKAASLAAKITGLPRKDLYNELVRIKDETGS